MEDTSVQEIGSFRDPAGFCISLDQKLLRVVNLEGLRHLESFISTAVASEYFERQQLARTHRLVGPEFAYYEEDAAVRTHFNGSTPAAIFEHEKIEFPSYPFEWAPEMLAAAGKLTLQLARQSLTEGFGLKDATPFNVLFRGSTPVFVDLLSFEQREPGDPLWNAYGQFMRTFLLPLLVNRRWGIPLADVFLSRRDGLEPEEVYRMCGRLQRLRPLYLTCVTLPVWLARRSGDRTPMQSRTIKDAERAQFILGSLYRRLERLLGSLGKPRQPDSAWGAYMETHSYSSGSFAAKERFVMSFLEEFRPKRLLDIGANTGHFSFLAAKAGASVVAIDSDPGCVGRIWRRASQEQLKVLPLVVELGRPTPAVGWRNGECTSFLARAGGGFDAVFMLAVLHHLLVRERVPLREVFELMANLTTDLLLVEFVDPRDEMFKKIARGRENLFRELDTACFEAASARHFQIVRHQKLPDMHRWLYLLRKRKS